MDHSVPGETSKTAARAVHVRPGVRGDAHAHPHRGSPRVVRGARKEEGAAGRGEETGQKEEGLEEDRLRRRRRRHALHAATAAAFAIGGLARFFYARSSSSSLAGDDYALATPATSAPCRREGLHLLLHGHDPLAPGGACAAQPPLLLATLATLPPNTQLHALILADLLCAALLLLAAPPQQPLAGLVAATIHLLSPSTIFACAAGSSAMLHGLLVLVATHSCARGHALPAAATLATAAMLAPDAIWMLIPLAALSTVTSSTTHTASITAARTATAFCLFTCVWLLLLAPRFGGVTHLLRRTIGAWLDGEPLLFSTPNFGLWWYLMSTAYLPLRPTFALAFHTLPRLCVPSLALSLRQPSSSSSSSSSPSLLSAALSHAVLTATKRAPTTPEIVLSLAFVGAQLDERILAHASRLLPIACAALINGGLAARYLLTRWVDERELNANFFYAATVLFGGGQLLFIYEIAASALAAQAMEDKGATGVQRAWRRKRID